MMNRACLDLVTALGVSRIFNFSESPEGLHNPLTWEKGNLRMQINETRVHGDGIDLDLDVAPAEVQQ